MAERRLADPGWYPDPANDRDTFRWWTGTAWTAWLTTDPGAEPPPHGREDLGPVASAEVPPRPPARFGTVHRVAMAVVAAAVVLAAVIVTGWPDRQRVVLSQPPPSAMAQLPDLSVTCDEPWSIAGQVRMTTGGFLVIGPKRSEPLPYLHCRGKVDQAGGNTMVSLGMSDGSGSVEETLQAHAERRMAELARTIYTDGPARVVDLASEPYAPIEGAWRVRGDLLGDEDDKVPDHVQVILVELDNGRRAVWIDLTGDQVTPEAKKLITEARESLERY